MTRKFSCIIVLIHLYGIYTVLFLYGIYIYLYGIYFPCQTALYLTEITTNIEISELYEHKLLKFSEEQQTSVRSLKTRM